MRSQAGVQGPWRRARCLIFSLAALVVLAAPGLEVVIGSPAGSGRPIVLGDRLRQARLAAVMEADGTECAGIAFEEPFPCLGVVDDFDRPDGLIGENHPSSTPWTHNWEPRPDEVTISVIASEAASTGAPLDGGSETWNRTYSVNQEMYVTYSALPSARKDAELFLRMKGLGIHVNVDGYICQFLNVDGIDDDRVALARRNFGGDFNDTFWTGAAWTGTYTNLPLGDDLRAGDVLGARIVDSTAGDPQVGCYINGTLVLSVTDTTPDKITGPGCLQLFVPANAAARYDDFGGGSLDALPLEVQNLILTGTPGAALLNWDPQSGQPDLPMTYDVLRAPAPGTAMACHDTGLEEATFQETDEPPLGEAFLYLVRAVLGSEPGPLGDSSTGPRSHPACDP